VPIEDKGNGHLKDCPPDLLENAAAALVAKADWLLWIVDNKESWLELLQEHVPMPIFTAREVLTLWPGRKAEFDTLYRVKKAIPGARMVEFKPTKLENPDIDPENDADESQRALSNAK
jgi:hypothetical protein